MSEQEMKDSALNTARVLADTLDDNVDADVAARLRDARKLAVDAAEDRSAAQRWRVAFPLGGAVAAALVAVVLLRDTNVATIPEPQRQELAAVSELEVLESLELLESLEMLAWLEDEDLADAG